MDKSYKNNHKKSQQQIYIDHHYPNYMSNPNIINNVSISKNNKHNKYQDTQYVETPSQNIHKKKSHNNLLHSKNIHKSNQDHQKIKTQSISKNYHKTPYRYISPEYKPQQDYQQKYITQPSLTKVLSHQGKFYRKQQNNGDMQTIQQMQQLKREQFYVQKLRIQRQRMEVLKQDFIRKDKLIESLKRSLQQISIQLERQRVLSHETKQQFLYELDSARRQNLVIKTEKQMLQKSIQQKKGENNNLYQQIKQQQIDITQLKKQLNKIYQQNNNLINDLQYQKCDFYQLRKQLEKERELMKEKYQSLTQEYEYLQKQIKIKYNTEQKNLQDHLKKLQVILQHKQAEIADKSQQIITKTNELQNLFQKFDTYKANMQQQNEQNRRQFAIKLRNLQQNLRRYQKRQKKYIRMKQRLKSLQQSIIIQKKQLQRESQRRRLVQNELRNRQNLIMKYKQTQQDYLNLIQKLKVEIKQRDIKLRNILINKNMQQQNTVKDRKLKQQLNRLRGQLHVLRNFQVQKIEKVFNSFTKGVDQQSDQIIPERQSRNSGKLLF